MRIFGSIEQFRHVVDKVTRRATYIGQSSEDLPMYDESLTKPTLTFTGTTKLHGTNAGIGFNLETGVIHAQSHYRILTIEEDNSLFCAWKEKREASGEPHCLKGILESLYAKSKVAQNGPALSFYVYGEWCGEGVNGKAGIGKLPKTWFIFSAVAQTQEGGEYWFNPKEVAQAWKDVSYPLENGNSNFLNDIRFITDFKEWSIDIDFNDPGHAIEELERLTLEVENECPVAIDLGVSGIGEGIVWSCSDEKYGQLIFKTKGDKHKGTKNRALVSIAPEVIAGRDEFVSAVLTESRLEQGFDLLQSQHHKVTLDHVGDFLAWVGKDVMKEEADSLKVSGLDRKLVMGEVNKRAKQWLLPKLAKF